MKERLVSLIIIMCITAVLIVPAGATGINPELGADEEKEYIAGDEVTKLFASNLFGDEPEATINDEFFFTNANISERQLRGNVTEFKYTLERKIDYTSSNKYINKDSSEEMESDAISIFAFDTATAQGIRAWNEQIEMARVTDSSLAPPPRYFLNQTVKLENALRYTTNVDNNITYYRITKGWVKSTINSGTTLLTKNLNYGCVGMRYGDNAPINISNTLNILYSSNPFTTYAPAQLPYVSPLPTGSGVLGITLEVTVKKNGITHLCQFSNNVFNGG